MTVDIDANAEAGTRERVIVTAESLFREIGYQKTTVADIAKRLHMSPANVYRFFDSKRAIYEAVAQRLMLEVEDAVREIVVGPGTAEARLRLLLATIHRMNLERYVGDEKIHAMVAMAMEESWDVCLAHITRINEMIGKVIAGGIADGAFHATDVALEADCVCSAMLGYFHPQMLAQNAKKPGPPLDMMIDFVMRALKSPG